MSDFFELAKDITKSHAARTLFKVEVEEVLHLLRQLRDAPLLEQEKTEYLNKAINKLDLALREQNE